MVPIVAAVYATVRGWFCVLGSLVGRLLFDFTDLRPCRNLEKKDDSLSLSLGGAWRGTLSGSSVDASTRFTCMTSWASSKDLCFTHTKHSIVPGWPYRAAMLTT
jgi:hypothetical protein